MQFNLVHFLMLYLVVIEHNAPTIAWHLQTSQHLDFYNVSWKVNNGNVFNVGKSQLTQPIGKPKYGSLSLFLLVSFIINLHPFVL